MFYIQKSPQSCIPSVVSEAYIIPLVISKSLSLFSKVAILFVNGLHLSVERPHMIHRLDMIDTWINIIIHNNTLTHLKILILGFIRFPATTKTKNKLPIYMYGKFQMQVRVIDSLD